MYHHHVWHQKVRVITPDIMKAYGEALSGSYGGLWGLPLLILIMFAIAYFQGRKEK